MSPIRISEWTLRICDQARYNRPIEDDLVDLKTEFPIDIPKAARQIAGLANAAYGETVLWIIGVNEKTHEIVGADPQELSTWWPQIQSQFDEYPPSLPVQNVTVDEKVVVALAFATDRAPFVVKVAQTRRVDWETPWREGTATKTAKRSELIRLLGPTVRVPSLNVLAATVTSQARPGLDIFCMFNVTLYVTPQTGDRVVFPNRKASLKLEQDGYNPIDIRNPSSVMLRYDGGVTVHQNWRLQH